MRRLALWTALCWGMLCPSLPAKGITGRQSVDDLLGLVLNEIQVANIDRYIDHSYNYGGWVELYNTTDGDIDISGMYLSDDTPPPPEEYE